MTYYKRGKKNDQGYFQVQQMWKNYDMDKGHATLCGLRFTTIVGFKYTVNNGGTGQMGEEQSWGC
jgi:hypothetical protein